MSASLVGTAAGDAMTAYSRLLERRERNHLQSVAEDLTDGEVVVAKLTPGQLRYIAAATGNPLCELVGEPLLDGCRRVALGPDQLDFLAVTLKDDEHPVAAGLTLILDLDERVVAGQSDTGIASHSGALVNTVAITAIQAQAQE
ncbi:hypothetical protein [Streptomyces sp. NPDC086776]|uniref:hypothetical protein n=1 Tax=Streptomyces sp. NPDC086776 TaxID=3365756 RepID=UPI003821AD09